MRHSSSEDTVTNTHMHTDIQTYSTAQHTRNLRSSTADQLHQPWLTVSDFTF